MYYIVWKKDNSDFYGIGGDFQPFEWEVETPTEAGIYWVKRKNHNIPEILEIKSLEHIHEILSVTHWLGPLPVPKSPSDL